MCGIYIGRESLIKYQKQRHLRLQNRGIYSNITEGCFPDTYLYHSRLPIQNISHKWDMPYETSKGYQILFVGEIYNYKELRENAESDLDLIVQDVEQYGPDDFAKHIIDYEGMYHIVIVTPNRIYLFTDPLSKKPLYYHSYLGSISSEIKALCYPFFDTDKNLEYLSGIIKWGYIPNDTTFDHFIKKVPPGFRGYLDRSTSGIYYLVPLYPDMKAYDSIYIPKREKTEYLRQKIKDSIVSRLDVDPTIPLSLLLSGGIDSSILYYSICKIRKEHDLPLNLRLFHIRMFDSTDTDYVRKLDIHAEDELVFIDFNPEEYMLYLQDDRYLSQVLYANESPADLGSMIPQYLLHKKISEYGNPLVITGDGADELFGGYRRMKEYDAQWSDIYHELVYYHLPRLDKMSMFFTQELRSPFLDSSVLNIAHNLDYEQRIDKMFLREAFSGLVPDFIIQRKKEPLKIPAIKNDPIEYRKRLVNLFLERVMPQFYSAL